MQINTGKGCHLDAGMVGDALTELAPRAGLASLFIENVGNLVCPAAFDLGEAARVVLLSVTEGDDKPLKYANMFAAADLLLVTKIDLLPYVPFDLERCPACGAQGQSEDRDPRGFGHQRRRTRRLVRLDRPPPARRRSPAGGRGMSTAWRIGCRAGRSSRPWCRCRARCRRSWRSAPS